MPRPLHRTPLCHPERPHAAQGKCFECYTREYGRGKPASCCPGRIAVSLGLCRSCYDRHLKKTNPEFAERQRKNCEAWHAKNREYQREKSREYNKQPSKRERDRIARRMQILGKFGLTIEDELRILASQNEGCGICGGPPRNGGSFDIDHDHSTDEFRGFLCGRCNKGLGLLGDTEESIERALAYLRLAKIRPRRQASDPP